MAKVVPGDVETLHYGRGVHSKPRGTAVHLVGRGRLRDAGRPFDFYQPHRRVR
jgi:hypothetical protein